MPLSAALAPAHPPVRHRIPFSIQSAKRIITIIAAVVVFAVTVSGITVYVWTKDGLTASDEALKLSDKALRLAEWTAKKDFYILCQSQQQTGQPLSENCTSILSTMPEGPPLTKRSLSLWPTVKRAQTQSQDQSKQDLASSLLVFALLSIAVALIFLFIRRYQVFARAEYRGLKSCKRHRCLTLEHDSHPSALEASRPVIGLSAPQLPIYSTVIRTSKPEGELRRRAGYRFQDSLSTFRFKAESADNKEPYEFTGVLNAKSVYSLISTSAARKYGQLLESTEFYFAPNKAPELSYVGQFALPSTRLLRIRICALDGSNSHREMELFVVDEEFETDCILASGFQKARFCY